MLEFAVRKLLWCTGSKVSTFTNDIRDQKHLDVAHFNRSERDETSVSFNSAKE